ncbi:RES domain-containing protein [Paratractidigestivibacter sp.]|uniref:RES domain-containing protein n=1 Tax=Paratractidigestivibacter sp. TaxID=2847316 RepID=UPI002AC9CC8E|nr:RES domain-containing protein [Paratractidigestivibacter sp.]
MSESTLWVNKAISKDLYAPFSIYSDSEYYPELRHKYKAYYDICRDAGADNESLRIVKKYSDKVLEALRTYYKGRVSSAHMMVKNLVKGCVDDPLAVCSINDNKAFPGTAESELQLFRARTGDPTGFSAHEMLHVPFSKRSKIGSYRFSIPGVPSLYLCNSSYGCWIEMGQPAEREFNVSPVVLDGKQRLFNLAVMGREERLLGEGNIEKVHSWLKLMVLMFATSFRVCEEGRSFKSEYIISQSVMLACAELGLDGIAYFSKRVSDEVFAWSAINLALFAKEKKGQDYGDICRHMKIDDSFNYLFFRQLRGERADPDYMLRSLENGSINNVGSYDRQFSYANTDFCRFDKFLFKEWRKEGTDWGSALQTR